MLRSVQHHREGGKVRDAHHPIARVITREFPMLHFCIGFFFLLLTLVLTSLYLSAFGFLVLLAKGLVHVYRQWRDVPLYSAWRDAAGEALEDIVRFFRSRRFAKMLMGLALFQVPRCFKWVRRNSTSRRGDRSWR